MGLSSLGEVTLCLRAFEVEDQAVITLKKRVVFFPLEK